MKIKFGAIIVDGRNKIGGHVLSKNRAGAYMRTKVTPINLQSDAQLTVRSRFGGLSSAWKDLTEDQRLAWNSAVAAFAKTDIFGDLKNPSGFNLHQALNNNLLNCSESAIVSPAPSEAVNAFTALSFTIENTVESMSLVFAPVTDTNHKTIVMATPAISPGRYNINNQYRQIAVLDPEAPSLHNALAAYSAVFGAIGSTGMKVFISMFQVNINTGQAGLPIAASALITLGVT